MGQYFYVVNNTKREYLHPHKFNDGLKLAEFGMSSCGTLTALAWLLADSDDHSWKHPMLGRWKGDSITVAGDYGPDDFVNGDGKKTSLHHLASDEFTDISDQCLDICEF